MTPGNGTEPSHSTGIVGSARRVASHASELMRLQRELARAELQRKGATLGAGAAVAIAAGVLALFAVGFGLATLAAVLALLVDWWLALLLVFFLLVVLVAGLLLAARSLFRAGTPIKPEQAIEEARLTKETIRGARGG
ncbi:MAG TPA: phage holin family protein [Gaiellaceae bacterium]|nr:phage holin family protein [Gaiellaceae bacterium]